MAKKQTNDFKKRYLKAKATIPGDETIKKDNRELLLRFLDQHENKLKRINGLRELDMGTYKTLYSYLCKFRNIDKWFNKPLKDITKDDIKRVYEALEDGKILSEKGKPFKSLRDYYNKFWKSKLFQMVGKDELAREVVEYSQPHNEEVRFITEDDFKDILQYVRTPEKKLLFWLAWDIGENINALLQLKKSDFYREINPQTKEPEYRVNLKKEILKRSRKPRSEITNYSETVKLLDQVLEELNSDDTIFNYDYANAKKIFRSAVEKTKVKCKPQNDRPTWKDLRSGMACDLLKKGWSTDEVNARLGHKPSSAVIDKYVNFLAIDRHTPKKKVQVYELEKLRTELEEVKQREKSKQREVERIREEMVEMARKFEKATRTVDNYAFLMEKKLKEKK